MSCYAQVADVLPGRQMRRMLLVGLQCLKAFEFRYQHYVACIIDRAEVEARTRRVLADAVRQPLRAARSGVGPGEARSDHARRPGFRQADAGRTVQPGQRAVRARAGRVDDGELRRGQEGQEGLEGLEGRQGLEGRESRDGRDSEGGRD